MKKIISLLMFVAVCITSMPLAAVQASAQTEYEITRNPDYLYTEYVDAIYDELFNFDAYVPYSSEDNDYKCYIKIDISQFQLQRDVVISVVTSMHRQYPELFFFSGAYSMYTNYLGVIVALVLYSEYEADDLPVMQKQIEAETAVILNEASKLPTDVSKVLFVHNYITLNTRYNENVLNGGDGTQSVYNIYGTLVDHDAVCQGYAYTFNYIMHRLGIVSDFVRSGSMNHGWSIVKLGDSWYHIDPTFDDPVYDFVGYMRYSYFLRSEAGILSEGHKDIISLNTENGTTTTYTTGTDYDNLFMRDQTNYFGNISYCNGMWYFIKRDPNALSNTFSICATADPFVSESELEYTEIKTLSCYWRASESSSYAVTFPGITTYNGRIYYSTAEGIYTCTLDGTDTVTVYKPERPNSYTNIYGLTIRNGYIYYNFESVRNNRTSHPEMYSCELPEFPYMSTLTPTEDFAYSTDGVYIWGIPEGTTMADIANSFVEGVYVTDCDGNVIASSDPVGSGYIVYSAEDSGLAPSYYILTVTGDLNGDACINSKDFIRIKKYLSGLDADIPYIRSADIDGDGVITESDLTEILNTIMAK